MAVPHVAGVAALLLSIEPDLTAAELKYLFVYTVAELNNIGLIGQQDILKLGFKVQINLKN